MIKLRAEISQADTPPINMSVEQHNEQLSESRLYASQYRQQPTLELPRLPSLTYFNHDDFLEYQKGLSKYSETLFKLVLSHSEPQQFQQAQQLQQPKRMARKRDEISPRDAEFINLFNNTIRKELDKTYTNPDYSLYGDDNKSQKRQRK